MYKYRVKLSPYHRIFYNEWKLQPEGSRYNIVFDQTISYSMNLPNLKAALNRLILDHLILNSHILELDDDLYWAPNAKLQSIDYFNDNFTVTQIFEFASKPFNLEVGPLYRFGVFHQADGNYRIILVFHHIVISGRSFDELIDKISFYYNDSKYKISVDINQQEELLKASSADFIDQIKNITPKTKKYWQSVLAEVEPVNLRFLKPLLKNNIHMQSINNLQEIRFEFSDNIIKILQQSCPDYQITPYAFGTIVFAILIHHYTYQSNFAISYPISIKDYNGLIYGALVNTNIHPFYFDNNTSLSNLIEQYKNFIQQIKDSSSRYNYYPINQIINNSNKGILDIFFVQTNLKNRKLQFNNANTLNINKDFNIDLPAKLLFEQELYQGNLQYRVRFNSNEIDKVIAEYFVNHYKRLFMDIIFDFKQNKFSKNITEYKLLTTSEYHRMVYDWSGKVEPYKNQSITKLFEKQVKATPNNIAIVYKSLQLTYNELNVKVNQLASYLKKLYKIKPNNLVALFLERNEYMVISILAVIKANGAYVPISIDDPDKRIVFLLNNIKPLLLMSNAKKKSKIENLIKNTNSLNFLKGKIVFPDNVDYDKYLPNNPNYTFDSPDNLAYVMYTSGSTGIPKGVMVPQSSVINFAMADYINIDSSSVMLAYSNYSFDGSIFDIFSGLLNGAKIVLINNEDLDKNSLIKIIIEYSVNIMFLTPALFNEYATYEHQNPLLFIDTVLIGGEVVNVSTVNSFLKYKNRGELYNGYGPTETTVFATSYKCKAGSSYNIVPIGTPLKNKKCYVLDQNMNPVPVGVIGELYIGGTSLAHGYLNLSQLTEESFVINPFRHKEDISTNNILYKTGDLVRWLSDGNLEYIDRTDRQIKIRGHRIELSEIEAELKKIPQIKQAIVLVNNNLINGYYVSDFKLDTNTILNYLYSSLPKYMIPNSLLHISKLPLTTNGKVDKNALPLINKINNDYILPPENNLQNQIINIFSKLLNLPVNSIGITDNFFKLGGNSILAITLKSKLSKIKELKEIKISEIFTHPTVEQISLLAGSGKKYINESYSIPINQSEIAIIAISGEFSGCKNLDEYWQLIKNGSEGVKRYTLEECRKVGISDKILINKAFVPVSGHIFDIDKFDAEFWGLPPKEAKQMDPQLRKFLEHSWHVLESAGYVHIRDQINISVFAGVGNSDYNNFKNADDILLNTRGIEYMTTKDTISTKTSYLLGLTGISNSINTACSTSLVNVIEACINLSAGYSYMAIAGGVSLLLPNEVGHIYQDGMIYSKDGYCSPFDSNASGIVHGSGVGVVLLKRLSDAINDNDNIIAIIKGYGINNDGNKKVSYTAPSFIGQKDCIFQAQNVSNIQSNQIGYVECHGTGTKLGDSIEIDALNEVFKNNKQDIEEPNKKKCFIGSVKANIGHTDIASGIAGLLKVCKMIENRVIPKQINYITPNLELNIKDTTFDIPTKLMPWDSTNGKQRIAGVSSFGIGGTNAHVIIGEYLPQKSKKSENNLAADKNYIINISAKSGSSLNTYINNFINYLSNTSDNIKDIAYTLQLRREYHAYRTAITCSSLEDAIAKLTNLDAKFIYKLSNESKLPRDVVFMFPGQGNQYANMTLDLYLNVQNYKNYIDTCINLVNKYTGLDFLRILFPDLYKEEAIIHDINQTEYAQIALFIVSYSLAKLLDTLGINATNYIGHSIGELVAATLSGVFVLEDALYLIVARGKLMQTMQSGKMLSIMATTTQLNGILENSKCTISVINSPENLVVSGTHEDIQNLKSSLEKINIISTVLDVSHAYHSPMMLQASIQFLYQFRKIKLTTPSKLFISNLTGDFITANQATDSKYWATHITKPVLFLDGLKTIFKHYNNPLFIEVGPGKSCTTFVKHHQNVKNDTIQLINAKKEYNNHFLSSSCIEDIISKIWIGGYNIEFKKYFNYNDCNLVKLPNYQFDSKSYWITQKKQIKKENTNLDVDNYLDINKNNIDKVIKEKDLTDIHYKIASIFVEVLGSESISIYDSFFNIGGDSLSVITLVTRLQKYFNVSVNDIFKLKTIDNLAQKLLYIDNNLLLRLQQIKSFYSEKFSYFFNENTDMIIKNANYLQKIKLLKFRKKRKKLENILLTGATGHLGCNILYYILKNTNYNLFLLVRQDGVLDAFDRVERKYKHYFNEDLKIYSDRITIFISNLEHKNLGLSGSQYELLTNKVDSIIHSAAIAKHYGEYKQFYSANVTATANLLDLAKKTIKRDFHYISTLAVLFDGYIPDHKYYIWDENDDPNIILNRNNVYSRSKYEGEILAIKYRDYGVNTNIYRLGNVAMHSTTYKHQTNINDNAFFIIAKTVLEFGIVPDQIDYVEVSPVDFVAQAIVKLFQQHELSNRTFHVFNPNFCRLSHLLNHDKKESVSVCSIDEFINRTINIINSGDENQRKSLERFMLHQGWLQDFNFDKLTHFKILQNETESILSKLEFLWGPIKNYMLSPLLDNLFKGNLNA